MDRGTMQGRYGAFAAGFPKLCKDYLDELWMSDRLLEALSVSGCFDARKIVLTGSGLGYAAAQAAAPVFTSCCDIFFGTEVVPQADFNYFNNVAAMGIGEPNTPLVVVLTEQADDPDAADTLKIVRRTGANSLLICSAVQSAQASLACSTLCLGLDSAGEDYLPKAYLKLLLAVLCTAYRVARVRGTVGEQELDRVRGEMLSYTASMEAYWAGCDAAARDFAARCAGKDRFDYIADWEERSAANFLGTLGARTKGYQYSVNDSEEWCHVNYWMECRFDLCTVMWGIRSQPSFSRTIETMGCVHKLERPYLLITDANASAFLEGTRCCAIPAPPEGKYWMAVLVSWLPALLALGYMDCGKEGDVQ